MKAKDLNVNQHIEISLEEEGTELKNLASRIEEVKGQYLYISIPTHQGQLMPFRAKQKLLVGLHYKGHLFQFNSVIEDRKFYPLPMLVIRKPETLREIQRRLWVRVPANLYLRYCLESKEKFKPINLATSLNVSGGGICFTTSEPLELEQILEMEINLPDRDPVICHIKVLRMSESEKKQNSKKVYAKYLDITEPQRDRIVSFVLERQRELIKKGLL